MAKITINIEGIDVTYTSVSGGYAEEGYGGCLDALQNPQIVAYTVSTENLTNATALYSDMNGQIAATGYYSGLGVTRFWNSSSGQFDSTSTCP